MIYNIIIFFLVFVAIVAIGAPFILTRKQRKTMVEVRLQDDRYVEIPRRQTSKEFNILKSLKQSEMDSKIPKIRIEIRKEMPGLFSIAGYLNPVEIFLDLRNNQDERIQISLGQMMNKWNFEGD